MCSSSTAKNIPIYSTGWHLWQADNVTIHHCEKEWQKNKLHYCNSVIIPVCSHELDVWKNRVNWRVLCTYHTTWRTWMSHFVSPAERLWICDIITTFCLHKLPQMPLSRFFFNAMDHDSSSDVLPFNSLHFSGKLPQFHLTVTVEKVKAVAPTARCFPCSTPPPVYGLGDFQLSGFGPLKTSSWMEHCFHGAGKLRCLCVTPHTPATHIKGSRVEQI